MGNSSAVAQPSVTIRRAEMDMAIDVSERPATAGLKRTVGFWGLMFVSLGSIIGSGWLLGAFKASVIAGPLAIFAWLLASGMIMLIGLVFSELGSMFPVSGGVARYPHFSFGGKESKSNQQQMNAF